MTLCLDEREVVSPLSKCPRFWRPSSVVQMDPQPRGDVEMEEKEEGSQAQLPSVPF